MIDKKSRILTIMQDRYNLLIEKGYDVLCLCLQGSQNYNLDIYTEEYKSDIDLKAIIIPDFEDVIKYNKPLSTTLILDNNEHIDLKDIRLMFEAFIKQNINYLEILFTDYIIINPIYKEFVEELLSRAEDISTLNYNQGLRAIKGMSLEKMKALKHPYPSLLDRIEKYGFDSKQLHHIIRLNLFLRNFIAGDLYKNCLFHSKEESDYLKFVKVPGNIKLDEAEKLADYYNTLTSDIVRDHLLEKDKINKEVIEFMKDLTVRILKFKYIKEFTEEIK